jgi:tetratricopeptide (TPR) repeat protein
LKLKRFFPSTLQPLNSLTLLTLLALLTLQPFNPSTFNLLAAEIEPFLKEGEELLDAWRMTEAQEVASRLLREKPKSASTLDFNSRVAFHQGRYEEALRFVEQALAIEAAHEQRQAFRLFVQRTHDTIKKLKRYESAHFILYLDEERDGILVTHVLDALEKSHNAIHQELGYSPQTKVRVEIAPDVPSFNAISTLSLRDIEETGAVGICKFNKLMTISPRALIQGYRWLDSLSHEYVHHAIVGLSNNKAPIWLHEGIARFFETRWRQPAGSKERPDYLTPANETLLARALAKNRFVGFKKMEPSLIYLETPEEVQLAYAEAASAIDFMIQRKGASSVRTLLPQLAQKPTHEAVETVFGISFDAFESQYRDFLKAKGLKEIEGSRVRRFKVKGETKEDEETVELKEIQSVVARNRTHLGDRLWERGKAPAAAEMYQRALQASPHSTIILNKLARIFIHMERYQEALPRLKEAETLDPDHVATHIQLGRLHYATKNHAAARVSLEEALQINPFNPTIHQLLQEIYTALGDTERVKQSKATLEKLMRSR